MAITDVQTQRDFSGGLNTAFESWQLGKDQLPFIKNMVVTKKGSIASAYGYSSVGSAGAGQILGLASFYTTSNRYLVRIYTDQVEYTQDPFATTPTWTNIETLGSSGARFDFVQYDDKLWYGDGTNNFRSWNGSSVTQYASAPKGNIIAAWRSTCWIAGVTANPSTLYYSDIDDFTDFGGGASGSLTINKQDGEAITGIVPLGDNLVVFKERSIWKVTFEFDQVTSTSFYSVTNVSLHRGAVAPRTCVVVNNDAAALSNFGVITVGQEANYSGLRTSVISEDIRDDLRTRTLGGALNEDNADKAAGLFFEDQLYISVPTEDEVTPNATYLYDALYNSWVYLDGVGALVFEVFRNSALEDYVFFGSSDGNVYYISRVHNQDGNAYTKQLRTARDSFGEIGRKKEVYALVITGTKAASTTISCKYIRDYAEEEFSITDDNLIQSTGGGGYVGENYFGDQYFGGTGSSDGIPQYRYRRIYFPDERNLFEMQLEFKNENADEPFSVDAIQTFYSVSDLQESLNS